MSDKTIYLVITSLIVGIVAFGGMLYNFQSEEVFTHTHPTHITTPHTQPFDNTENLQALTNLELKIDDQRAEYTREIVQVKRDLQNAQIGTGDQARDDLNQQSGTGTTPKLTIHLDSNEFIRGEIIWISGTSEPLKSVESTITDPNLRQTSPTANADQRGNFKIGFATEFDDPLGTYTVYVRSQGERSQTLSFVLTQ